MAEEEDQSPKRRRIEPEVRGACQHGIKCYRRNPRHLVEYSHPELEELYAKWKVDNSTTIPSIFADQSLILDQLKSLKEARFKDDTRKGTTIKESDSSADPSNGTPSSSTSSSSSVNSKIKSGHLTMKEKWDQSIPINFFLVRNHAEPRDKYDPLSITFREMFHGSMGVVKSLLHINYMVEADFFINNYIGGDLIGKETTLLYGVRTEELKNAGGMFSDWLKIKFIQSPFPYGHHHTKMSIVQYEDESLRVMVYTANLISSDWDNRTQGVWISPKCSKLNEDSSPEPNGKRFKADLLQYLSSYSNNDVISDWIEKIRLVDFSPIRVILIATAPNPTKSNSSGFQWGLKKLEKALTNNTIQNTDRDWSLVMQCSSIGTLGASDADWLRKEIGSAMTLRDSVAGCRINLVYPSHSNVLKSYDGVEGGGCLPYSGSTHMKQQWLRNYFYQWKSDSRGRSRAIPHIKSYFRLSPDEKEISWFLLTSANLSKAAWGKLNKDASRLSTMSWEAGILFLPSLMISKNTFKIREPNSEDPEAFPLPFDLPLTKYEFNDRPWVMDTLLNHRASSNT